MAFESGKPRAEGAGRKPGTPNKRTLHIKELADSLGADPAEFLINLMLGNEEAFKRKDGTNQSISFEDQKDAAKELMPYLYGKRKPVDANGNDEADPLAKLAEALRARN